MEIHRCANCTFALGPRFRSFLVQDQPPGIVNIVTSWIAPLQLSQNSAICRECLTLVQNVTPEQAAVRLFGHQRVCRGCGCSVLRARSHVIYNTPEGAIISSWLTPNQINNSDHACRRCFTRATARLRRQEQHDAQRDEQQNQEIQVAEPGPRPPQPPPMPAPLIRADRTQQPTILLPHYKRPGITTSRRCIFLGCHNERRLLIPADAKYKLLKEYKLYIPNFCRICDYHLQAADWEGLVNNINTISLFTAQQIENALSFYERNSVALDFEHIENMSVPMCKYWLGRTSEDFLSILSEVPSLQNMECGRTALAILLIKLRTNDSNERLATLFDMSRRILEKLMILARNHLFYEFVPQHIGLHHLTRQEVAQRDTVIPNGLFGNPETSIEERPAIVICDGTYTNIQKSSNYAFQKKRTAYTSIGIYSSHS